jgi:hypothetical protein
VNSQLNRSNSLKKAPALLYLIIFILLLATLISTLGLTGLFRSWNWLRAIEIKPGTIYLVFKNLLFALGFFVSAIAFTLRKHWAPGLAAAFTILSAAWYWVDRALLNQSPLPFSRHIFALVMTILLVTLLLLSYWSLAPFMHPPRGDQKPKGASDESA